MGTKMKLFIPSSFSDWACSFLDPKEEQMPYYSIQVSAFGFRSIKILASSTEKSLESLLRSENDREMFTETAELISCFSYLLMLTCVFRKMKWLKEYETLSVPFLDLLEGSSQGNPEQLASAIFELLELSDEAYADILTTTIKIQTETRDTKNKKEKYIN